MRPTSPKSAKLRGTPTLIPVNSTSRKLGPTGGAWAPLPRYTSRTREVGYRSCVPSVMEARDNERTIKILADQLEQRSQFVRTNIQLIVQWFIFFASANYIVFGYVLVKMGERAAAPKASFYGVAGVMVAVNVLAIVLCWNARGWFSCEAKTGQAMLDNLVKLSEAKHEIFPTPWPCRQYSGVVALMTATIISILVAWLVMLGVMLRTHT